MFEELRVVPGAIVIITEDLVERVGLVVDVTTTTHSCLVRISDREIRASNQNCILVILQEGTQKQAEELDSYFLSHPQQLKIVANIFRLSQEQDARIERICESTKSIKKQMQRLEGRVDDIAAD